MHKHARSSVQFIFKENETNHFKETENSTDDPFNRLTRLNYVRTFAIETFFVRQSYARRERERERERINTKK